MSNSRYDYARFIAQPNDIYNVVWKNLLTKEVVIGITSELAEKSGKFDDTNYCCVEVAPEIFEKFIITETGLNYTVQTVDAPRLLEYWEVIGFPLCIDKS